MKLTILDDLEVCEETFITCQTASLGKRNVCKNVRLEDSKQEYYRGLRFLEDFTASTYKTKFQERIRLG